MNDAHQIRRAALMALCQFDAGQNDESIQGGLEAAEIHASHIAPAMTLARDVWDTRTSLDAQLQPLTTDWPSHRQPVIDRALLRLACFELTTERVPPKVAINEAVELAREFSTEHSPAFVNGVLDQLWHTSTQDDSA